jgi:phage tail-like protein
VTGEAKPVHGGYHITLDGVPGAPGLLFYSATTPSGTLDAPKFKTWDANGGTVNSAGGGRQVTWGPVTLSRGVDDNKDLYKWFKDTIEKGVDTQKKDLKLIVMDSAGKTLHTWSLVGAHITQYSDSGHNAQTNEILVNTIQIEYESADLV